MAGEELAVVPSALVNQSLGRREKENGCLSEKLCNHIIQIKMFIFVKMQKRDEINTDL